MPLSQIGTRVRQARLSRRLTQRQLAENAGLSRATVNQIERGALSEIGVRRLSVLLRVLDLRLTLVPLTENSRPDFLRMACISASTSFRSELTVSQLRRGLLTGIVPAGRAPHFRVILEELPQTVFDGMINAVGGIDSAWRVRDNLLIIARRLGVAVGAGA